MVPLELRWRSGVPFLRAKIQKPPKRYKDLLGGLILAPSGNSFSLLPPEGLDLDCWINEIL
jgi:hypothetical protein